MNLSLALRSASALASDARLVVDAHARRGSRSPRLAAAADPSLWAVSLLRASSALRAATGSSLGSSAALRLLFHIDAWSDQIGPGLRLPHPFNIVIGEGAAIGSGCTLMHNVTVQRGQGTSVGDGAVLADGVTVLSGSSIGKGSVVGSHSVVRGAIPPRSVAVGAPARVARPARPGEAGEAGEAVDACGAGGAAEVGAVEALAHGGSPCSSR